MLDMKLDMTGVFLHVFGHVMQGWANFRTADPAEDPAALKLELEAKSAFDRRHVTELGQAMLNRLCCDELVAKSFLTNWGDTADRTIYLSNLAGIQAVCSMICKPHKELTFMSCRCKLSQLTDGSALHHDA